MRALKKIWPIFLSFLPLSAGAVAPLIIGTIVGITGIAGFSIYRSAVPVNMSDSLNFFSSCWSCQLFSDVIKTLSDILPLAYTALGHVVVPFAIALTGVWIAWRLFSTYVGNSDVKPEDPWTIGGGLGVHIAKLGFVCILLLFPLPRLLTDVVIDPVFNIGLSVNHLVSDIDKSAKADYGTCIVATAAADAVSVNDTHGIFSPHLRHGLACELANVHQMTGLGMTVGWTMLNMAFDSDYMHKIMWNVPIFPNVPIFFSGLLVLVLFFFALLPVPLYFLEVFVKLSLDLIMLPFFLLSWLFNGWKIFPQNSGKSIQKIVDDVVSGVVGIALVSIFVAFAVMFLNAIFGNWNGASVLQTALSQNDSKLLMDGLMMRNDSLVTIIMMGIFMAMFMIMIPALVKTLFNVSVPDGFYNTAKKDAGIVWNGLKNWWSAIKK